MKNEKLIIERISLHCTFNCNLRCEKCCVRIVEYKHKYNPDLDFVKHQIDEIFRIADKINYVSVEGGEPLLYKDFTEVMRHVLKYIDKIGVEMPVITNGSIMPSAELIELLAQFGNKAYMIIDYYGDDKSPKTKDISAALKNAGVRVTVKDYSKNLYYGGWVDLYGKYEQKHSREESIALYKKCAWAQKLQGVLEIIGGLIFFCPSCRMFRERGVDTSDGYIDMFDKTTLEEKREKIRSWYGVNGFTACMYCNGIHNESERFTPAVQLTAEQLKKVCVNEFKYRESL